MSSEELKRVEELKHNEELLYNCIDYLIELWGINEKEEIIDKFKNILSFTDEDIRKFEI